MKRIVHAPPDVVAGVVALLRQNDVDARTMTPATIAPGTVRVSRLGGQPVDVVQDEAEILIEVWESDQAACFQLARAIWALCESLDGPDVLPGLYTYRVSPVSMPQQFWDDQAPTMDRHQFAIVARVHMDEMEVN